MRPPNLLLFSLVGLALAPAPRPARAAEPDAETRAAELETKAHAAARAGKFDEAASTLRAAWSFARWSSIACNLGRIEFSRKRYRDAAEFLAPCIDSAPPVRSPEETRRFATTVEQFAEARAHVVTLLLSVNNQEATVFVDGQRAATPPLPRAIFVEPGNHRIEASLEGFARASTDVHGSPGDAIEVDLTLRALPNKTPSAEAPPTPHNTPPRPLLPVADAPKPPAPLPPEPSNSRSLAISILSIGAGVSVGVGVTAWIFSGPAKEAMLRESSAFQRERGQCQPEGCGAPEAQAHYAVVKNTAISAFVLSGAFIAAAGIIGLWPSAPPPRSGRALPAVIAW